MTETTNIAETADLDGTNYPDAITCICGNSYGDEGFMEMHPDGLPMFMMGNGEAPEGMSNDYSKRVNAVCYSCGREYSDAEIIATGVARVVRRWDTSVEGWGNMIDFYRSVNQLD